MHSQPWFSVFIDLGRIIGEIKMIVANILEKYRWLKMSTLV